MRRVPSRLGSVLLAGLASATAPGLLRADPLLRPAPESAGGTGEAGGADRLRERQRSEQALRALERSLAANAAARASLAREIEALAGDRARLAAALVETAARIQASEARSRDAETRLADLGGREAALRRSLDGRRALLSELLAALQRMGLHPPPAVLVRADDVLSAVRTSMLLGSALPGLREEARALAADLSELARLRSAIAGERDGLAAELAGLAGERDRLSALVAARQARLEAARAEIGDETLRGEKLGTELGSVRELLSALERRAAAAEAAENAARKSAEQEGRLAQERFAAASARDPTRLGPRQPFGEWKGALPRPVVGRELRAFGDPDGSGGALRGPSFATRPRAVVTAPADGWIAYAGPFRSYGRLLIMNVGDGYYLVLAGLAQSSVAVGQFVLAGEPVGQMGEGASASAASGAVEAEGPVLYVELRKDGGPLDPSPWWARSQSERARG